MTRFSDLPNEIVIQVWRHVLCPKDIESFAQVSKATNTLAESSLREHRRLKKKYTRWDNGSVGCGSELFRLLRDVLLYPHVALYIQELFISDWRDGWEDPTQRLLNDVDPKSNKDKSWAWHAPYSAQDTELFAKAVDPASHVLSRDVTKWRSDVISGNEDAVIALLLVLLPNISSLAIGQTSPGSNIFETIDQVAKASKTPILSKLTTVMISDDGRDGPLEAISVLKPFALMPSVKELSCFGVTDQFSHITRVPSCSMPVGISNITHLEFIRCGRIAQGLYRLLTGFKALNSFTYFSPRYSGSEDDELFWIRITLLAHARQTLEVLRIDDNYFEQAFLGDLSQFEVLRSLETIYHSLEEPEKIYDTCDDDVVEKLPASIQEIKLTQIVQCNKILAIFIPRLLEAKGKRLANLEKVTLQSKLRRDVSPDPFLDQLIKQSQANGIELTLARPDFEVTVVRVGEE